ncbi:hypothetical protein TNCT_169191 [Trichonephila clavata]|uniref:Uncharacterized protein n=1 Tax=Trichonephila clavata TaxID=2740835 RepID=A0A8X6LJX2_TRICU|nr:hypothetical protein TNCT_169191 [Trichonephila clavata]
MNDKIATESNTKNTPADINTLKTSNRRNYRNKRRQNFERQKERRSMRIRDCSNRMGLVERQLHESSSYGVRPETIRRVLQERDITLKTENMVEPARKRGI